MLDQIKIGKFIAQLRKSKNMTQQQLGDQLGVSFKTVSKWETGRGMPELSTLKPLSDALGVSINELLSGEMVEQAAYIEKLEENVVNTIDFTNRKLQEKRKLICLLLMLFGLFTAISAVCAIPAESSWGSIYACIGMTLFLIGTGLMFHGLGIWRRTAVIAAAAVLSLTVLLGSDYIAVRENNQPPRFRMNSMTRDGTVVYETLFYNVYKYKDDDRYHIGRRISLDDLDWGQLPR